MRKAKLIIEVFSHTDELMIPRGTLFDCNEKAVAQKVGGYVLPLYTHEFVFLDI